MITEKTALSIEKDTVYWLAVMKERIDQLEKEMRKEKLSDEKIKHLCIEIKESAISIVDHIEMKEEKVKP